MTAFQKHHIISESNLIDLIQKAPSNGIKILYENYSMALKKQILRLVPCNENAEDILQEVFIKVWKKFPKYDVSKGRLYTWMVTIAQNEAIDFIRSNKFVSSKSIPMEMMDANTYADYNFKLIPEHIGIKELLEGLLPLEKNVMDLLYFQGYTQSEISASLQLPLGTVKSKTRKAYWRLKRKFEIESVEILDVA
jgi:RNA polymerase sigma factor (sigma-70 family)